MPTVRPAAAALLLAAFAALAACNVGPKRNFSSVDGEFSCDIPEEWTLKEATAADLEIVSPNQESGLNARIAISKTSPFTRADIEKIMADDKAEHAKDPKFSQVMLHGAHFSIFKGLSYSTTRIADWGPKTDPKTAVVEKLTRVYFHTPRHYYVVEYRGPSRLYEKYRPVLSRVLNTYRWNRTRS